MHENLIPVRRNTNGKQSLDTSLKSESQMNGLSQQSASVNDQNTPSSSEANEQPVDILSYMGFKL